VCCSVSFMICVTVSTLCPESILVMSPPNTLTIISELVLQFGHLTLQFGKLIEHILKVHLDLEGVVVLRRVGSHHNVDLICTPSKVVPLRSSKEAAIILPLPSAAEILGVPVAYLRKNYLGSKLTNRPDGGVLEREVRVLQNELKEQREGVRVAYVKALLDFVRE